MSQAHGKCGEHGKERERKAPLTDMQIIKDDTFQKMSQFMKNEGKRAGKRLSGHANNKKNIEWHIF